MNRFPWPLLPLLCSLVSAGDIVINEIHFQPLDKTVPEEFIELYNQGTLERDLSGWFFSEGVDYEFPPGTTLAPESYLVVAEDPPTLAATLGVADALGPYGGRFANEGERVVLRNATGEIEDDVDYQVHFPWPLASGGRGSSMELIHPSLDNDLGGSWRASGLVDSEPVERVYIISSQDEAWHYRKGTSESSDPISAWREVDFVEDGSWLVGKTSIGYGDNDDNTPLNDMSGNYWSIYLRHTFYLDGEMPTILKLRVYVDDGCIFWINGKEVDRFYVLPGEKFHNSSAVNHDASWDEILITNPAEYLQPGSNVVAIHVLNSSFSSSDLSIDIELFVPGSEDMVEIAFPTPGEKNSVFSIDVPPQIRQVRHLPEQPFSGEDIMISAKVTDSDGVAEVLLQYQVVLPGNYLPAFFPIPHDSLLANPSQSRPANPAFEDPANWNNLKMFDDGIHGDGLAGDGTYAQVIPEQGNRTLVRYRITALDTEGNSVTVPYLDDNSLNFALFVYDGVPPYVASTLTVHPEGPGYEYPVEVMTSLPVYFLITRAQDLTECVAYDSTDQIPKSNEGARDKFNWEGAFVYDGFVYDHIRYRLRQANDRYGGRGKRSMRIRFHQGNYLRVHDNYGRSYPTCWRTLNTGKMFDNKRVGNFGLTETLNHNF